MLGVRNKLAGVWSGNLGKDSAFVDAKSHWAKQHSLLRKRMTMKTMMQMSLLLFFSLRARIYDSHWVVVSVVLDLDVVCFLAERGWELVVFGLEEVQGRFPVLEVS